LAQLSEIRGVTRRISATKRKLTSLAVVRAYWPFLLFVSIFLIAALFGVFERAPKQVAAISTLVFLLGGALLFLRGLRRYSGPEEGEALEALDRQSELRPLASITDSPADPNPNAQTLWKAHTERLKRDAARLRPPSLRAAWKTVDPMFLRGFVPVALVTALFLSWPVAGERLGRALSPDYGSLLGADSMQIEAWVTPPDYSGRAPIFLTRDMNELRVPEGSKVTLRAQSRSAPKLEVKTSEKRKRTKFAKTPDGAYEAIATLEADSRVAVRWWGEREAWTLNIEPDDAPTAAFAGVPSLTTKDQTEFGWSVTDDYGVATLELAFELVDPHPAAPDAEDRVPVPLPGLLPREASETEVRMDLTRHRWAGLKVRARLVATDGAGQEGYSKPHEFVLPNKLFLQPVAAAVQEIRVTVLREPRTYGELPENPEYNIPDGVNTPPMNRLDAAPEGVVRAALMLDGVTYEGPRYFNDYTQYLALRTARGILEAAPDKTEADTVDPLLWAVALKAEYGSAADALEALLAAKKALEKALRDGASEEEIKRLTEAFREAAENYVAAKMAEAIANGMPEGQGPTADGEQGERGQGLGNDSFTDMLNALEDLTETGASDQARQLLSDITNMLENLEFQQGQGTGGDGFAMPGQQGEGGEDGDAPQEEREMSGVMEKLSDLLREQRELNDDTLEEGRDGGQQGQQGEQGQQQGEQQGQQGQQGQDGGQQPGGQQGNQSAGGGQQIGPDGRPLPGGGGSGGGTDPRSLADRQAELRDLLEEFAEAQRQLGEGNGQGEGGETPGSGEQPGGGSEEGGGRAFGGLDPETLEGIGRAQDRAEQALRQGRQRLAERNQEQATRLMRDMASELAEAIDELREARLGDNSPARSQTDPFGRPIGGANDGSDVAVPDQTERQRAKDILDELRKRYGDAVEEDEREYLERLLDRF